MFPAAFQYHRATSVDEALRLLGELGEDAKLISGGQSLLPMMKFRLAQPAHLIDIGAIPSLNYIRRDGNQLRIGAATRHAQLETDGTLQQSLPALSQCAGMIGDVQVRNRGTIGGSLAHADPAADLPAAVLALEGQITAVSRGGSRTIAANDFFVDLMTTALKPHELLGEISFALPPAGTGAAYVKFRQPASGFAIVGVAAIVRADRAGNCEFVRIGITGLSAKPFRAAAAEAALNGKPLAADAIAQAAAHAADGIDPLDDIHASAEFRAHLACVHTGRALTAAMAQRS